MTDDRINDPDVQIDSQIMKLVEQYASCDRRSADINDERATIRGNAEKLGFTSQEFQDGVRRVKKMSKTERDIHERNVLRIVNIAETRQAELWPKETARQNKRAEERAAQPRSHAELDAKTDTDPKSDPAAGGAQIDLEEAIAAQQASEQAEGAAVLDGKSDEWRRGFTAFYSGAVRTDIPAYVDPGAAQFQNDWLAGYDSAILQAPKAEPATLPPAVKPKKQSQSAKAAAIAAAVQGKMN